MTVPEMMSGTRFGRSSRTTSAIATSAALAFSVSKMVSTRSRSTPPSIKAVSLLRIGLSNLIEGDRAKAWIVDVRRKRGRDRQRSQRAGNKPRYSSLVGHDMRCFPGDACRFDIDLMRERSQFGVVDHALEKFGIFAAVLRFAEEEEIVQADCRCAEGIGFDQIRAGLEVLRVNLFDYFRLGELKKLNAAF